MSLQLITAIRERVAAGMSKEAIEEEVCALGHSQAVFATAYEAATNNNFNDIPPAALPSSLSLIKAGYQLVCARLDVVALLAFPLIAMLFVTDLHTTAEATNNTALTILAGVGFVILAIGYLVAMCVAFYTAGKGSSTSYKEALAWTRQHLLALVWILLLLTAVVFGGFLLFFIPGIIIVVSTYFSQLALLFEDKRGMSALVRSRTLVAGRWFLVARKLAGIGLYVFLTIIPLVILAVLLEMVFTNPAVVRIGEVLFELLSAALTLIGLRATAVLYPALAASVTKVEVSGRPALWYTAVALFGAVLIPALLLTIVYFAKDTSLSELSLPEQITPQTAALEAQLALITTQAEVYRAENGSFEAVCESLQTDIVAEVVVCNDTADEWALQIQNSESRVCADAKNPLKRVQTDLGERTTCLSLPPLPVETEASAENAASSSETTADSLNTEAPVLQAM